MFGAGKQEKEGERETTAALASNNMALLTVIVTVHYTVCPAHKNLNRVGSNTITRPEDQIQQRHSLCWRKCLGRRHELLVKTQESRVQYYLSSEHSPFSIPPKLLVISHHISNTVSEHTTATSHHHPSLVIGFFSPPLIHYPLSTFLNPMPPPLLSSS